MPEPFKNQINADGVREQAAALKGVHASFPAEAYIDQATSGLDELELKDRVRHVAAALYKHLPNDFVRAARLLCAAMPPALPTAEAVSSTFAWWPFLQFIEDHGVAHPDAALDALERMTQTFSAEFAIRPLIVAHRDQTLKRMLAWTTHPSVHVRRLASEGSRPRLPWGLRLTDIVADPSLTQPILQALKQDDELYVRRSVANHVNDIAKDHPDRVADWMDTWMADANDDLAWVVRHALRGLVKKKHPGALRVLGFSSPQATDVTVNLTPQTISLGDRLTVQLSAKPTANQRWMMDITLLRPTKNGTGTLVFKGVQKDVRAAHPVTLSKTLAIKSVTTRTYYPGEHRVQVVVNGMVMGESSFVLEF